MECEVRQCETFEQVLRAKQGLKREFRGHLKTAVMHRIKDAPQQRLCPGKCRNSCDIVLEPKALSTPNV